MTRRRSTGLRIPIPKGATREEEAAITAAHPGFRAMMDEGRSERQREGPGRTHEEVWADLDRDTERQRQLAEARKVKPPAASVRRRAS